MAPDRLGHLPWELRYRRLPAAGSWLRQRWATSVNGHGDVRFGDGCRLGSGFHLQMPGRGSFSVGDGVEFRRDFSCEIGGAGRVEIGSGTIFTYGTVIQCSTEVTIGEHCAIGKAFVVDGNHRFRDPSVPTWSQGYDHRPVTIGAGTSVSSFCVVMADIGRNCFVGAGAVVTEPIPDFCLAVGSPARVVEYYGPPESRPAGLPG